MCLKFVEPRVSRDHRWVGPMAGADGDSDSADGACGCCRGKGSHRV